MKILNSINGFFSELNFFNFNILLLSRRFSIIVLISVKNITAVDFISMGKSIRVFLNIIINN